MILKKDYINYKKKFASGGQMGTSIDYGAIGAGVTSLTDTIDQGNGYGRQKTGSAVLKGAASGAALGTSILPGWGTAIGAVVGAGVGFVSGNAAKKKEIRYNSALKRSYDSAQLQRSQAELAMNPEEVTGYNQGAEGGYYANGGQLPRPVAESTGINKKPVAAIVDPRAARLYKGINDKYSTTPVPVQLPYEPSQTVKRMKAGLAVASAVPVGGPVAGWIGAGADLATGFRYLADGQINNGLTDIASAGLDLVPYGNTVGKIGRSANRLLKTAKTGTNTATVKEAFRNGGQLQPISKTAIDVKGPSHAEGGVQIGANEVEGDETIDKGYVFSSKLGFSDLHRPLAKAMGKIEKKPYTEATVNSLNRMNERVEKLKLAQEFVKTHLNH